MRLRCAWLSLALLFSTGWAAAQSADQLFQQGVDAFRRGDTAAAAQAFKEVLASNPGDADAYRMLDTVEQRVLMDMLVDRGELGQLAERFLGIAQLGRLEIVSDPGQAAEVVDRLLAGDMVEQERAMLELRASYGEWAVPALIGPLGDASSIDNRVKAMQALVRMGSTAVVPLLQVLKSEDTLLRRNAAAALGTIGDPRAIAGLAWLARDDEDAVTRQVASDGLAKLGQSGVDPVNASLALADGYFRGVPELVKPYDATTIVWSWNDGMLEGMPTLGGLYPFLIAEGYVLEALGHGMGQQVRPLLAAIHAAQQAEILAAQQIDLLAGNPLLEQAAERLPDLAVDLALAGQHRGAGVLVCLSSQPRRLPAAIELMKVMGGSPAERQALHSALGDPDVAVSQQAALALATQGEFDGMVITRLGEAVAAIPPRLVMSIGDSGLAGGAPGWQLLAASTVQEGLLRAKAFPPKDVVVLRDGLQNVTLDTMIFGLRNDPRTAEVPIIVVTSDVDGVESLYGDQVAAVVASASFADVEAAAGERSRPHQDVLLRARRAAEALTVAPAGMARQAAQQISRALASGADDDVKIAVLGLVARAGIVEALPVVEAMVAADDTDGRLHVATLRAAAQLWALTGGGSGADLSGPLLVALDSDDAAVSRAAAEALGQLRGVPDGAIRDAIR